MNPLADTPTPTLNIDLGNIVFACRLQSNARAVGHVLNAQGWPYEIASTLQEVVDAVKNEAPLIILTEDFIAQAQTIDPFLDSLNQQPEWSAIPVILLLKDDHAFPSHVAVVRNIQQQRGVTLVELPLKPHEFVSMVRFCLQNRQRQFLLRDTLHRLQESNQALESFGHTVAHELRNPLGTVTTSLDLLSRSSLEPKQQKLVQVGLRSSHKMNQIIKTLLDYGKLNARDLIQFEPVDMDAVAEQVIQGLQPLIDDYHAQIHCQALPQVWGNGELLSRLLSNLIKNAMVHHGDGVAVINILAVPQTKSYLFQVSDNGPGIPVADQSRIFAMFARSGTARTEGSGIGLALCRRIVEQHRGQLWVESAPGQGSTFYFELPGVEQPVKRDLL